MGSSRATLVLAILLITVGTGWLLTALDVVPGIDWIWTLGLFVTGLLTFLMGGIDKVTFVLGSFFVIASVLSVLRQTGRLSLDVEVPLLIIILGILMLVARHPSIPVPNWIVSDENPGERREQ
ncbi:MAG: hypothetical protein GXP27_20660 [Planctomycetes bacterium]|nr:hypothetical protein [Planctomycetota bacterium]